MCLQTAVLKCLRIFFLNTLVNVHIKEWIKSKPMAIDTILNIIMLITPRILTEEIVIQFFFSYEVKMSDKCCFQILLILIEIGYQESNTHKLSV